VAKTAAVATTPVRDLSRLVPVQRTERLRPSKSAAAYAGGWEPGKDEARGKAFGTLVHALFQHLEWDREAFVARLAERTWPVEEAAHYDEALAAITRCLSAPAVQALLCQKPEGAILWNERKATLMHDGKLISAVFDRVHVIPGHSATIVDYKTNDCTLEHLKETYQGQMDLYRIAVAKLCGLGVEKVRCVLVHVRAGQLVEA
jgi:ATP-dependent exoDNAse (exonuclease V) beta subunit